MTAERDTAGSALTTAEIEALLAPLAAWPLVMLAVSGGPDSLALLHIYARWRTLGGAAGQSAIVATVDHGMRPEARAEAEFVASQAQSLGLAHETLAWLGGKPSSGRQQAARVARYQLMGERLARENATPRAIVTAHTLDDQAETVLMRLARGSGLDGLAAMTPQRNLTPGSDISIVRPLLGVPGARLKATLRAQGRTWIEDPSNRDPAYERVRLRERRTAAEACGLTSEALGLAAHRMQRAQSALEAATSALEVEAASITPGIATTFARKPFERAPFELRLRLLSRALIRCGGNHPAARLTEIERLVERLDAMTGAATLGGCLITPGTGEIAIIREPGRNGLEAIVLKPGMVAIWDNRFEASLAAGAPAPVTVRAMTPGVWCQFKVQLARPRAISKAAALTLPAFWHGDDLVALPSPGALLDSASGRHIACITPDDLANQDSQAMASYCSLQPYAGRGRVGPNLAEKAWDKPV